MGVENTSDFNSTATAPPQANAVAAGDTISAATFTQMLDVLESLASHSHIFYDDYTTVCECQCACACGRGTV
jgi:hypothetical protein